MLHFFGFGCKTDNLVQSAMFWFILLDKCFTAKYEDTYKIIYFIGVVIQFASGF